MSAENLISHFLYLLEDENFKHVLTELLLIMTERLQSDTTGSWHEVYEKFSEKFERVNYPRGSSRTAQLRIVAYHAEDKNVGKAEAYVWEGMSGKQHFLTETVFSSKSYSTTIERAIEFWTEVYAQWEALVEQAADENARK
jgi:hypothetical protein